MRGHSTAGAEVVDADATGAEPPGRLTPTVFVAVAAGLARRLDEWHRRHGPHLDLCPATVRADPAAAPALLPPAGLAGPEYRAPELTGRILRAVDERSDLYALGVLFHTYLTGELPAAAGPGTIEPAPLAEIVDLLLAPRPEDRYRSAGGLAEDLERCRDQLASTGTVDAVLLRTRDLPARLLLGDRLHGRDSRLARLQAAYERVAAGGGAEVVAVTGAPGLGRSALAAAFADAVVLRGGRVARARCDPLERAPYAPLVRLLTDLAGWLAGAPAQRLRAVADAVGGGADVLLELAPALGPVLGAAAGRPRAPARSRPGSRAGPDGGIEPRPAAARAALRRALRDLFGAVAQPGRPLVITLGDVEWLDAATAELLGQALAGPAGPAVLAVATHQANAVRGAHPARALLGDPRLPASSVPLRPLPDSAIAALLADVLGVRMRDAQELSHVVAEKTGSNPLLIEQFLYELAESGALVAPETGLAWQYQLRDVTGAPPADAAEVARRRLARLTPDLRRLVRLAAVAGREVDARLLAAAGGPGVPPRSLLAPTPTGYRWLHELLRQAVLDEVDDGEHAALARALGEASGSVDLLNAAIEATPDAPRRRRLARLDLDAGRRALRLGHTAAAVHYLGLGRDLADGDRDLGFALHLEEARAELAAGSDRRAEWLLERARPLAADDLDRAAVARLRCGLLRRAGRQRAAVAEAAAALAPLGVDLPADPAARTVAAAAALRRVAGRVAAGEADRLAGRGRAPTRPALAAAVLAELIDPEGGEAAGLLAAVAVELALDHGATADTAYALACLAAALDRAGTAGDGADGAAAACVRAAWSLLSALPDSRRAAAVLASPVFVLPAWYDSPMATVAALAEAPRAAAAEGDTGCAQLGAALHLTHRFAVGLPLAGCAEGIANFWRDARGADPHPLAAAVVRELDRAVARLTATAVAAPAETLAEAALRARLVAGDAGGASLLALAARATAGYLLGDEQEALAHARAAAGAAAVAPPGGVAVPGFVSEELGFVHALAAAAAHGSVAPPERPRLRAELERLHTRLDRLARRAPAAFGARADLVAAERARLAGDAPQARARFERAVSAAREQGCDRLEAVSAELAGRFLLGGGEVAEASAYLRRARHCYERWGATVKLGQLEELLAAAAPAVAARDVDELDLLTVVRAFHAISAEPRLDRLVVVLLDLFVRYSRAERGCLLLAAGDGVTLAAEARVGPGGVSVRGHSGQRPGDPPPGDVPRGLVDRVRYGGPPLVGDAAGLDPDGTDPYLARHRPRSVLCAPVLHGDRLVAVLYLEHRRLAGAFSTGYLELLEVLRGQAATALANAATHARLDRAERIVAATYDALPVGLVLLDARLRVRRASARAVELTGLAIQPGDPLPELFDRHVAADGPVDRRVVLAPPGGGRRELVTTALPVRDGAGALLGVTLLIEPAPPGGPGEGQPASAEAASRPKESSPGAR